MSATTLQTTLHWTVSTTAKPESVLPHLVDFENATEWDYGTLTCDRGLNRLP